MMTRVHRLRTPCPEPGRSQRLQDWFSSRSLHCAGLSHHDDMLLVADPFLPTGISRTLLLRGILPPGMTKKNLSAFANGPLVGVVGAQCLIHEALCSDNVHSWSDPGQQLDTMAWATLETSKSTG